MSSEFADERKVDRLISDPDRLRVSASGEFAASRSERSAGLGEDESPTLPSSEASPGADTADSPLIEIGEYELFEVIASGGMGVVYRARQRRLNRIVALKVVLSSGFSEAAEVQRFQAEAELAAGLQHPGIVPIYEVGEFEGRHYYSMECVDGPSLARAVSDGPLEPRRAAKVMEAVADAVAFAHRAGIVHRDLKPGNILLDSRGLPHVTDFGLAKNLQLDSSLTGTGQVLGTPTYMSPEQAVGDNERVGPLSDVYSLGAVLYCLLTGGPPFRAASAPETLRQVVENEPVSPGQANPAVDRDLETICLRCLEKNTAARYESAEALRDDLRRYLHRQPIVARPIGHVARAWRWCLRNPYKSSLWALLAGITLAVAVGGPLIAYRQSTLRARADGLLEEKDGLLDENEQLIASLRTAVDETLLAQQAAEAAADSRLRQLIRMHVDEGNREVSRGNVLAALPWYASALSLEQDDARQEWAHRMRLASALSQAPELERLLRIPADTNRIDVSPGGKHLAIAGKEYGFGVREIASGEVVLGPIKSRYGSPVAVEFSPDGRLVAAAFLRQVIVWNMDSMSELFATGKLSEQVQTIALNSGGTVVAIGHRDGSVQFIDLKKLKGPIRMLTQHHARVQQIAFSSDGRRLLTASGSEVILSDSTGGELITDLGLDDEVAWIGFHPNGKSFFTATKGGVIQRWNASTGDPQGDPRTQPGMLRIARLDSTGSRLATGGHDSHARIWDTRTGALLTEPLRHDNFLRDLNFSDDGRFLVTASSDRTARIWDTRSGEQLGPDLLHNYFVDAARFLPAGDRLVTVSGELVRVWRYRLMGSRAVEVAHDQAVKTIQLSPGGDEILTASVDGEARLWNARTGEPRPFAFRHPDEILEGVFSHNGRLVATVGMDSTVGVWSTKDGRMVNDRLKHDGGVHHAEFSPDDHHLLTAGDEGAFLWDVETGQPVRSFSHGDRSRVIWATFSASGRMILTGGTDGSGRVWDTHSGKPVTGRLRHASHVEGGCFSPDESYVVTASRDHSAQLWSLPSGEKACGPWTHFAGVHNVCFTPDGRYVVTGGRDANARIWNVSDGSGASAPITIGTGLVRAVVSPCGRFLATGGGPQLMLWEVPTGRSLGVYARNSVWVNDVAFSPDSRRLLTAGEDGTAAVWDIPEENQRDVQSLLRTAELTSGHRADAKTGLTPLTPDEMVRLARDDSK